MRIGVGLPQVLASERDRNGLGDYAVAAEQAGFDSLWVLDQVLGPAPTLEAVTSLAYVAALTDRVRLGTAVLIAPARSPLYLAKLLASLDRLSGGRLIAGLGTGDVRHYRAFGLPEEARGARFAEAVRRIRAVWANEVEEPAAQHPGPVQQPGPPIWLGSRSPRALERATALGDGWIGAGSATIDSFEADAARVRELAAGRPQFDIGKRLYVHIGAPEAARAAGRAWFQGFYGSGELAASTLVGGHPEAVVAAAARVARAGATHLLLHPVPETRDQLDRLAGLLPALRAV